MMIPMMTATMKGRPQAPDLGMRKLREDFKFSNWVCFAIVPQRFEWVKNGILVEEIKGANRKNLEFFKA